MGEHTLINFSQIMQNRKVIHICPQVYHLVASTTHQPFPGNSLHGIPIIQEYKLHINSVYFSKLQKRYSICCIYECDALKKCQFKIPFLIIFYGGANII